jgi:hypothetical protein
MTMILAFYTTLTRSLIVELFRARGSISKEALQLEFRDRVLFLYFIVFSHSFSFSFIISTLGVKLTLVLKGGDVTAAVI